MSQLAKPWFWPLYGCLKKGLSLKRSGNKTTIQLQMKLVFKFTSLLILARKVLLRGVAAVFTKCRLLGNRVGGGGVNCFFSFRSEPCKVDTTVGPFQSYFFQPDCDKKWVKLETEQYNVDLVLLYEGFNVERGKRLWERGGGGWYPIEGCHPARGSGAGSGADSGANAAKFTMNVWEKSWFWCSITRGSLTFYSFYELQTKNAS